MAGNPEHLDSPVYWFVVLERARERNDFALAAEAQRQLERLGVWITFRCPKREVQPA